MLIQQKHTHSGQRLVESNTNSQKNPHQNGAGCPFAESQMGSTVAW